MKRSVYDPVKEQLLVALEYIRILEVKKKMDEVTDLINFRDYFQNLSHNIIFYFKYELLKRENKDG